MGLKIKKIPFAFLAVHLIITSMLMGLFMFSTDVKAAVYGPKYYYLSIEKQNIKKAFEKYKQNYLNTYFSEYSYSGELSAGLKGDFVTADEALKKLSDFLSTFELKYNFDMNAKDQANSYFTAGIQTKLAGRDFAAIGIKSADNNTIVSFPGMTEKMIGIKGTANKSENALKSILSGDEEAYKELFGLDKSDISKLFEKYIKDVIVSQIPNKKVIYLSDVKYKGMDCNSITFNIDEDVIADIYRAVSSELRKDQEFRTIYKSTTAALYSSIYESYGLEPPTDEEIDEQIQSLCDELEYQAEDVNEVNIAYTVYFTNSGDILFRQFTDRLSDSSLSLDNYTDLSGTDILKLLFVTDGEEIFALSNEGKLSEGIFSGTVNLSVTELPIAKATYSFEKDAKVGGLEAFIGSIRGVVNMEQFPDAEIGNINFSLDSQRSGENTLASEVKVFTSIQGKGLEAVVNSKVKQSNKTTVTKPEISLKGTVDMYDSEGMGEILQEIYTGLSERFPDLIPKSALLEEDSEGLYDPYLYDFESLNGYNE